MEIKHKTKSKNFNRILFVCIFSIGVLSLPIKALAATFSTAPHIQLCAIGAQYGAEYGCTYSDWYGQQIYDGSEFCNQNGAAVWALWKDFSLGNLINTESIYVEKQMAVYGLDYPVPTATRVTGQGPWYAPVAVPSIADIVSNYGDGIYLFVANVHAACNADYPSELLGMGSTYMFFEIIEGVAQSWDPINDNTELKIKYITEDISASQTWVNDNIYVVSGDIEIDSGKFLRIEPGTIVKFDADNGTQGSLTVNGTLIAEGGVSSEEDGFMGIYLTSLNDDNIRGDTNNDGNSTGTGGDWGGITVNNGGSASFKYSTIRYAGLTGTSEAQIHNNGGTVNISNDSYVIYGTEYGIKNTDGILNVDGTDIGFNEYGVYVVDGTVNLDGANVIHDNNSYGVYNADIVTINAENNSWGDPSGPYHATNLTGTGNPVSNNVDFDPWDDDRHYLLDYYAVDGTDLEYTYDNTIGPDYTSEIEDSVDVWNNLGIITIDETNGIPDVAVKNENAPSEFYAGVWDPIPSPTELKLNTYHLATMISDNVQSAITHEFGHALGLAHSYSGNVMYKNVQSQIMLGAQDVRDYNEKW